VHQTAVVGHRGDEGRSAPATGEALAANAERFSGFAGLYDRARPEPPAVLGEWLGRYVGRRPATAVDLGSGTGLSTRWLARWADEVVGVEPSADMRAAAAGRGPGNTRYVEGWGHRSGLPPACADVVVAVQSLHWMEPASTFAEVVRLLRPGGVFAAIDCDWPPSVGSAAAERAWAECRGVVRAYERRLAAGPAAAALRAPLEEAELAVSRATGRDPHRADGAQPGPVRSWSKDGHLARMEASGLFWWCTEVACHQAARGDAAQFVEVLRSQGDYQSVRRAGVTDELLGLPALEARCREAFGPGDRPWLFTYRARLGVVAGAAP
jgi:SAM-dependent methyltransferase